MSGREMKVLRPRLEEVLKPDPACQLDEASLSRKSLFRDQVRRTFL